MKTKIVLHSIVFHVEVIYQSFSSIDARIKYWSFLNDDRLQKCCHQNRLSATEHECNYWSNLSATKPRYHLWIAENFALLMVLIWYIVIYIGVGVQKCWNPIQFTDKWLENYSWCLFQVSRRGIVFYIEVLEMLKHFQISAIYVHFNVP